MYTARTRVQRDGCGIHDRTRDVVYEPAPARARLRCTPRPQKVAVIITLLLFALLARRTTPVSDSRSPPPFKKNGRERGRYKVVEEASPPSLVRKA